MPVIGLCFFCLLSAFLISLSRQNRSLADSRQASASLRSLSCQRLVLLVPVIGLSYLFDKENRSQADPQGSSCLPFQSRLITSTIARWEVLQRQYARLICLSVRVLEVVLFLSTTSWHLSHLLQSSKVIFNKSPSTSTFLLGLLHRLMVTTKI